MARVTHRCYVCCVRVHASASAGHVVMISMMPLAMPGPAFLIATLLCSQTGITRDNRLPASFHLADCMGVLCTGAVCIVGKGAGRFCCHRHPWYVAPPLDGLSGASHHAFPVTSIMAPSVCCDRPAHSHRLTSKHATCCQGPLYAPFHGLFVLVRCVLAGCAARTVG